MKTTVEISDPLLREIGKLAACEGVTLRILVDRGLRRVVVEAGHGTAFKLRRASFKGDGLQTAFRRASWDRVRDAAYKNRGG